MSSMIESPTAETDPATGTVDGPVVGGPAEEAGVEVRSEVVVAVERDGGAEDGEVDDDEVDDGAEATEGAVAAGGAEWAWLDRCATANASSPSIRASSSTPM